jgi:hypothetical protein
VKKVLLIIMVTSSALQLAAADIDLSMGLHTGFVPGLGGSLESAFQRDTLGVPNGVHGINRSTPGIETKMIEPLLARQAGADADLIFLQRIRVGLAVNAVWSAYGGTGYSIDSGGDRLKVSYSMRMVDVPLTIGVSIPAGTMSRFSLSAGLAFNYGIYENSFESATIDRSSDFRGWALPLVVLLKGEFFLNNDLSLTSSLSHYRGFTEPLKSGSDYARIDFSGVRWDVGLAFRIKLNVEIKGV